MGWYTIEVVARGTWALEETPVRAYVRGFALEKATWGAKIEGAYLNVRRGRKFTNGAVLSSYQAVGGKWVKVHGAEIRGLAGLDAAGCYMAHYEGLSHVTREYAERQTGTEAA